jgi:hypothetical protein
VATTSPRRRLTSAAPPVIGPADLPRMTPVAAGLVALIHSVSSLPLRAIRDEIREVAPGLYLGVVYWVGAKTINFSLRFRRLENE